MVDVCTRTNIDRLTDDSVFSPSFRCEDRNRTEQEKKILVVISFSERGTAEFSNV